MDFVSTFEFKWVLHWRCKRKWGHPLFFFKNWIIRVHSLLQVKKVTVNIELFTLFTIIWHIDSFLCKKYEITFLCLVQKHFRFLLLLAFFFWARWICDLLQARLVNYECAITVIFSWFESPKSNHSVLCKFFIWIFEFGFINFSNLCKFFLTRCWAQFVHIIKLGFPIVGILNWSFILTLNTLFCSQL